MANLTLSIDDDVLRRARIRAIQEDTSVNARVREFLLSYARDVESERRAAIGRLIQIANNSEVDGGMDERTWTRDDLHER